MAEIPHAQTNPSSGTPGSARPGPATTTQSQRPPASPIKRQYVSFAFYKLMPEFRRLPQDQQRSMLTALADLIEDNDRQKMILLTYSCVGTRPDVDFMFWKISFDLDAIQNFTAAINRLPIAGYLVTPHSFLAQTKRSTYIDKLDPSHDKSRTVISPEKHK